MNLAPLVLAAARRLASSPQALIRQSVEFLNRAEAIMVPNIEQDEEDGNVRTLLPFRAAVQTLALLNAARERLLEFSRMYPNLVVATTTPLPLHTMIPELNNLILTAAQEDEDEVDLSGGAFERLRDGLANSRALLNQLASVLPRFA